MQNIAACDETEQEGDEEQTLQEPVCYVHNSLITELTVCHANTATCDKTFVCTGDEHVCYIM